ncbi:DUF1810 domain-containing protein [Acidocella sp. KAb 2-4]|uniref:DUF1810 domain-containing protein n=1 Tax=Acidocella sp. KAb 2-4 TaxID=2885158 RepID=UPI001D078456|nr:DUF1810 domain-containing protein [Acidocella sp. KAb 2-4]MCB5944500.1 DUF1810 domain-containing protein [Acidocella sp. KAb 2-4]
MAGMDPFNLARFLAAQAPVLPAVRAELAAGHKRTHWMWFIFPQLAGLGASAMSQRYAISGLAEARAYLAHPQLGQRLLDCTRLAMQSGRPALDIFGPIDEQKLRSCLTLFAAASAEPLFTQALAQFFGGAPDQATLVRLSA